MKLKRSSYHRCSYHILMFIVSHLWSGIDSESAPGYSIKAPLYVTVQRGLCVDIPCRFAVPKEVTLTRHAVGIWINTKGVTVASNSKMNNQFSNNGRFFLVGDIKSGDCSLYIEDPLPEDEGRYHFRVENSIKFSYQDIWPHVQVTDLTDKPEISPIKSWLDGEVVTLTCTAPGRCKRINPQITWKGNIQNGKVENWTTNHRNGTKTYFSTITFTSRKEQNNSTLSCNVRLREGLTTVQQITIKVEFQLMSKSFPVAAMFGGCFVAVLIVIGIFVIMFYKKRKMMQKKENSRQSHVRVADPIYGNSEMFPNGPHEAELIPQKDDQSPPETETVHLNCQEVQYMSVDFSKLKPQAAAEIEEIAYAVVKRKN